MSEIKYMIDGYTCTGELPNITCTANRKCILPDSVATAFNAYMDKNGIESILLRSEGITNQIMYDSISTSVIDWTQWFDRARLERLLAFSEGNGYSEAAEEIKKVLGVSP